MKINRSKIYGLVFALAVSIVTPNLFAQSDTPLIRGTITDISRSKKIITIDSIPFYYTRDTHFYIHGSRDKLDLDVDFLQPGFYVKFQVIETDNGVVLTDVGWVTG